MHNCLILVLIELGNYASLTPILYLKKGTCYVEYIGEHT